MAEELKKKVFVGDTGVKADVIEEDRDARGLDAQYSKSLLTQAAQLLKPIGSDYVGFGVVFYYEKDKVLNTKEHLTVCQTDVSFLNEGFCDLGWKNLRAAFMKAYDRPEPKTR